MENSTTTKTPSDNNHWLLNLIGLLFFAGLAWWSYSDITRLELKGGYLSLPKPIMLLYDLMGKWAVVGFWLLFVLYNLIKGIILFIKEKQDK